MKRVAPLLAAAALAACASTYELKLMPRTSGTVYTGEAVQRAGTDQADVTIAIDNKVYTGTWVVAAPDRSNAYVSGGFGFGGWGRRGGLGTVVTVDNPQGGEAKALLQAADGTGLRCDFKGLGSSRSGGGTCQDDTGLLYDVQIRLKS